MFNAKKRLVNTLLELIKIDSPSGDEKNIAKYITNRLNANDIKNYSDNIGNVIAYISGSGKPLLLNAHMDNVSPCKRVRPVIQNGIIRTEGATVLGADDKAGIAIILELIQYLLYSTKNHIPLEVVFTVCEEDGMRGSKNLDFNKIKANQGICLDASGSANNVVIEAPSHVYFRTTVYGKSAHSGVDPEAGINAITLAAKAINELKLGRIDEVTTANIGIIRGGDAINIIPQEVCFEGEVRSRDPNKLKNQLETIKKTIENVVCNGKGRSKTETEMRFTGYKISSTALIVTRARKAIENQGLSPCLVARGGGTDANIFNERKITTINLGVGYQKHHSCEEELVINEMYRCYQIIQDLVLN